jgi:hypothetical protein
MGSFEVDLKKLKKKAKDDSEVNKIEMLSESLGFIDRNDGKKRRGRKPSLRTGQVHAKVMPYVSDEISNESRRRGTQQGVIIEEAWELYKKENKHLK